MPLTHRLARLERSVPGLAAAAARRSDNHNHELIRHILSDIGAYDAAMQFLHLLPAERDRPPRWDVHAECKARPELAAALNELTERLTAVEARASR